jgi:hypothetical protein
MEVPVELAHLPPLVLSVGLLEGYPEDEHTAPIIALSSHWLPTAIAAKLAMDLLVLWGESLCLIFILLALCYPLWVSQCAVS